MANLNLDIESLAKSNLQPMFPQASSITITPTTISKDEQAIGIGIVNQPTCNHHVRMEFTANSEVSRVSPNTSNCQG